MSERALISTDHKLTDLEDRYPDIAQREEPLPVRAVAMLEAAALLWDFLLAWGGRCLVFGGFPKIVVPF